VGPRGYPGACYQHDPVYGLGVGGVGCPVDECAKPRGKTKGGLCWTHYARLRKHGDTRGELRQCWLCGAYFWAHGSNSSSCSSGCVEQEACLRKKDYYAQNTEHLKEKSRVHYLENKLQAKIAGKAYRETHKDRINARSRAWREANPTRNREVKAQWYRDNLNHAQAKSRSNYLLNREAYQQWNREWVALNPDLVRAIKKRYKLKRAAWEGQGFKITTRGLNRISIIHRGACAHCDTPLIGRDFHWDHVVPLSRGGSHGEGNLVPACAPCNLSKGSLTVMEWRLRGG